jgi:hypothetical protein
MPLNVRRTIVWSSTFCLALVQFAFADPMPAPPLLPTPQPHIGFSGGDGSSCGQAVVITGAKREAEGVRAQRWWIFTKNIGSKVLKQTLSNENGRDFETLEITTADGTRKRVCFDITSFYGKP